MKNIETKVKVDDFSDTLNYLKNTGISYKGKIRQKDTYFHTFKGYLKHREINSKRNQLICYERDYSDEQNISYYKIVKIPGINLNKEICDILKTTYHTKAIILKKRRLWIYKNTRIHLDVVTDLGFFIELETVAVNDNEKFTQKEHEDIRKKLHLDKYENIQYSYLDMAVIKRNNALYQKDMK